MGSSFINKVVWITGASSGIGEALSYAFAQLGAKVILSARSQPDLMRVKSNCPCSEENIFVLPLDLTVAEDIGLKAQMAIDRWGHIDYLIHNAGIASRDLVQETQMSVYRTVMETNYFGPVALTKAVLPFMVQSQKGHIVVISSLSGKYGVPKLSAYAASKHALHGFFESLRAEVAPYQLKISVIIPGFINTPIITKALDGSGNQLGKNMAVNEKGLNPQACAAGIIKAIRQQKQEALIGRTEMLTVYFHRFFPRLFSSFISHHPVQKLKRVLPFLFK